MSNWTLAPALDELRDELNAKWPNRSTASDGTIGDAAHQARVSEHNPDRYGVVRAMDVTQAGIDVPALLKAVIGDERVHYVIADRTIYSRTYGWRARSYTGSNPHNLHVHISLRNQTSESADRATIDKAANDRSAWFSTSSSSSSSGGSSSSPRLLKDGVRGADVKRLQDRLNAIFPAYRHQVAPKGRRLVEDGIYGPHTEGWVREFQRRTGLKVDGIVGPRTRAKLARYGIKGV